MKRKYPKNRKRRLLTNTMTYKLEHILDLNAVIDYFIQNGQYKTAERFMVSPFIVRYVILKHGVKRPLPSHLLKGYKKNNWPPKGREMRTNYIPDA